MVGTSLLEFDLDLGVLVKSWGFEGDGKGGKVEFVETEG